MSKDDRILNGMIGYLKQVDFDDNVPVHLWLHFEDDLTVGQYRRSHFGSSFPAEVKQNWTPLSRTSQTFYVKAGKRFTSVMAERCQFPLEFTRANTFYKFQGQSKAFMKTGYVFLGGFYTNIKEMEVLRSKKSWILNYLYFLKTKML